MGYLPSATTTSVTAKLTPYGRKKLLSNTNNTFVSYFALGDSDANYNTNQLLTTGEVPSVGGDLDINSGVTNSVGYDLSIRNKLMYNDNGGLYKPVGSGSFNVTEKREYIGYNTISGDTIPQNKINKSDYLSESLVNLFNSFGLPTSTTQINKFINTTKANGGFKDTALSGLTSQDVIVLSIPNAYMGEMIDGKTLKVSVDNASGTIDCYSTFQKTNVSKAIQDGNIKETSTDTVPYIGDNIVFLFSDDIKKPNGDVTKSWSTGYNTPKPFTLNNKELYYYIDNSTQNYSADTIVGIGYLDKGFIVLTHEDIVDSYTAATHSSATTISFNSLSREISQSVVCDALTSEFRKSTNPTFLYGANKPRISEIGLYDENYELVAIAKLDRHYELNNMYFRVEVKITV